MPEISLLGRAILGLLRGSPLSGYDIRRSFTQTPLATFSDSPGAIYPALNRLEAAGLVKGRVEPSAGLRNRKVFRLTAAGTSAFERWLRAPVTRDDVVRGSNELMLRFSFMELAGGATAAIPFLRALEDELKTYIPELKRYLDANRAAMPRSGRLALESGIRAYETLLQWSRHARATYERH